MAGEDHTNKTDLRATPVPQGDPDGGQKDAPLPAFIYGRDGQGDGNARGAASPGDRQNLNAWIADMDRKTLLGLVTGAGMLGLVLFFAGMLVGAGLFMDSDDTVGTAQTEQPKVEMLASAPEEPAVIEDTTPKAAEPAAPEISSDSNDPVGDLIAQRTEALSDDAASGENAADTAEASDTDAAETSEAPAIAAPEIRDVTGTPDAPAAPEAPAVDAAQDSAAAQTTETAPAEAPEKTAEKPAEPAAKPKPAPSAPVAASTANADKPFSVQVGAFKVHENASQRAEELRAKGLEVAVVVRGPEGDGAWYYVRIGSYANLAAARDDAAKIKADHSIDGFPVRAEPNDRVVN